MRLAVFLAACFIASIFAPAHFQSASAQQEFQAHRGEASQRLVRRAFGLPQTSTITQIAEVTAARPVVGTENAPTLSLSAYGARWSTDGHTGAPEILISDDYRGPIRLQFFATRGTRYLVTCDILRFSSQHQILVTINSVATPGLTWETSSRGALLVPPRSSNERVVISFALPQELSDPEYASLRRCTLSTISA